MSDHMHSPGKGKKLPKQKAKKKPAPTEWKCVVPCAKCSKNAIYRIKNGVEKEDHFDQKKRQQTDKDKCPDCGCNPVYPDSKPLVL